MVERRQVWNRDVGRGGNGKVGGREKGKVGGGGKGKVGERGKEKGNKAARKNGRRFQNKPAKSRRGRGQRRDKGGRKGWRKRGRARDREDLNFLHLCHMDLSTRHGIKGMKFVALKNANVSARIRIWFALKVCQDQWRSAPNISVSCFVEELNHLAVICHQDEKCSEDNQKYERMSVDKEEVLDGLEGLVNSLAQLINETETNLEGLMKRGYSDFSLIHHIN